MIATRIATGIAGAVSIAHLPTGPVIARRPEFVNDTHSGLNPTLIARRFTPQSVDEVMAIVRSVRDRGEHVSVCGSGHAMGGQQYCENGSLIDMRAMKRVLDFDRDTGVIHVEAGITWPELIRHYVVAQRERYVAWGIRQKQSGADRLTIGGAVSANIHGRGLAYGPFVDDLESIDVVLADGSVLECSRTRHPELFRLVVGGYGLFGVVTSARIRLVPRQKVERIVELTTIEEIATRFQERLDEGYLYGDFQFSTAPEDRDFLSRGVFSCYRPVTHTTPFRANQVRLSAADWRRLLYLAHRNKLRAFNEFADFYLQSNGQIYWSDTHQLSIYLDDYHQRLDRVLESPVAGSEMITELYVPRDRLAAFMDDVRRDFRRHDVNFIYGTIRLIERDTTTLLAWAQRRFACVIFNLHVDHDDAGIANAESAFRRLIDIAIHHDGSYFLTYHRWATAAQLRHCYPQFGQFLDLKRCFDPQRVFESEWYRHYAPQFGHAR